MQPSVGSGLASVVVQVTDESGMPLSAEAFVKLTSDTAQTQSFGTTHKRSEAQFDYLPPGDYEIEASAAGYETGTQKLYVMSGNEVYNVLIRLKGSGDAILKPGQLLAPKAQKEAERGLAALKLGNLDVAKKHFESALKMAPTNADLNFLIGFLYEQQKDIAKAEGYFVKATSFDPQNVRAQVALGELREKKGDYAGATAPLQKAVGVEKNHWRGHWALASAYLHQQQYEKARDEAHLAISTGKGQANGAEVILGQALLYLGKYDEAAEAFQAFLREEPKDPAAPGVRDVLTKLQSSTAESSEAITSAALIVLPLANPALETRAADLPAPKWKLPSIDDEKPVLARGATCPARQVIDGATQRVKQLADNVARFDATEDVVHEDLNEFGKPFAKQTRRFDYQVEINGLEVREYRGNLSDAGDFPDHIETLGLPGLAFVFHPSLRGDFEMTCEGLGDWRGQAAWLIYFRQRSDRAGRLQVFQFSDGIDPVSLKGRAWIAAGTWHILHLEADLMDPIPKIQLRGEHQAVDYGPVAFKQKHTELWLPTTADIYLDFRRRQFHRRHSFGSYKLFSVDSTERINLPKAGDDPTGPGSKIDQ
jgi:tetratricopeptide (TPR) repeat protein